MSHTKKAIGAAYLLVLSGCAPAFDSFVGSPRTPPTTADLVTHIQCEIYKIEAARSDAVLDKLQSYGYVAFANLTLEVTNYQGFSPNVNFISPYPTPMTNQALSVGAQLTDSEHRTVNQTFTIDLNKDWVDKNNPHACDQEDWNPTSPNTTVTGLKGDLGLEGILIAGLKYSDGHDFIFRVPTSDDQNAANAHLSPSLAPAFGSTIDFTVVYGLDDFGPSWTLTHFKGPGSGSQGLLNFNRTLKDTLIISFAPTGKTVPAPPGMGAAPVTPPPPGATAEQLQQFQATQALQNATNALLGATAALQQQIPSGKEGAGKAAQDNATRMLLQNFLNN